MAGGPHNSTAASSHSSATASGEIAGAVWQAGYPIWT